MAIKNNEVANNANEQTSVAKTTNVYISVGEYDNGNKLVIGHGALKPYQTHDGKEKNPSAKDVMYKVSQIDAFLKSVDADKLNIDIKGTDKDGNNTFMKASAYLHKGIGENGKPYGFNKIAFTIQPEIKTPNGEIKQNEQKIYATKTKMGYAFDQNADPALITKFNEAIKGGAEFTLAVKSRETLEAKYPKLLELADKVKGGSTNIEIEFVKTQGAVIKNIALNDKSGNAIGEAKLINHATTQNKTQDIGR